MPPSDSSSTTVKHYPVGLVAGAGPLNPSAKNPQRNFYYVENVGLNEGLFWFDDATNRGQAIRLGPGDYRQFDAKVPIERVFMQSTAGTTFAVIEGYLTGELR